MMENYVIDFATKILNIDSPTGYCKEVIEFVKNEVEQLGYRTGMNNKGNLYIYVDGKNDKTIGLCAHVDTLGLMVRSIRDNGELAFTNVGGPIVPTLDGEYCRVITRENKIYTGTILSNYPAAHVYEESKTAIRKCENMHIRLDEVVKNKEDVTALGIDNGDYIAIDPKTTYNNVIMIISTYEEVGHGSASIPENISELIAVDMGCIGDDLACSEYDVSICAKDSSGPYDYGITSKFIELAKAKGLNYAEDIYPFYGSDVSAALRGGNDIKGGLIGPGVHASHGMERSHQQAINNTIELILAYLQA